MSGYNLPSIPTISRLSNYIPKNDKIPAPENKELFVNDLHNEIDKRENDKSKVYDDILKKCHNHIVNTNKESDSKCTIFKVPVVQFGVPVYDIVQCVIYIMNDLINRGFKVQFQQPNMLLISWFNRVKPKPVSRAKFNDDHDVKNLTYHPTDIKTLEYKTRNMFG